MIQKLRKSKGFTLIEMLVVIAIIAVLVSIIVPTVSNSTGKARAAADAANLRSFATTIALDYMDDNTVTNANHTPPTPKSSVASGAHVEVYNNKGNIEAYYVKDSTSWGIDYFSSVAEGAETPTEDKAPSADSKTIFKIYTNAASDATKNQNEEQKTENN